MPDLQFKSVFQMWTIPQLSKNPQKKGNIYILKRKKYVLRSKNNNRLSSLNCEKPRFWDDLFLKVIIFQARLCRAEKHAQAKHIKPGMRGVERSAKTQKRKNGPAMTKTISSGLVTDPNFFPQASSKTWQTKHSNACDQCNHRKAWLHYKHNYQLYIHFKKSEESSNQSPAGSNLQGFGILSLFGLFCQPEKGMPVHAPWKILIRGCRFRLWKADRLMSMQQQQV